MGQDRLLLELTCQDVLFLTLFPAILDVQAVLPVSWVFLASVPQLPLSTLESIYQWEEVGMGTRSGRWEEQLSRIESTWVRNGWHEACREGSSDIRECQSQVLCGALMFSWLWPALASWLQLPIHLIFGTVCSLCGFLWHFDPCLALSLSGVAHYPL